MDNKPSIPDRIIEYSVYAYVILMFLSKGEGIRNIIIYGSFTLWLTTIRHRKNTGLLITPPASAFWIYAAVSVFSVIFSLDPHSSFHAFRGSILKACLLFPVIATVMTGEQKLKNLCLVCLLSTVLMASIGYYSYAFQDLPNLKPNIPLMNVYHNKFARYMNTLIPFAGVLFFVYRGRLYRALLSSVFLYLVTSIILSTSRGGYISLLTIVIIWAVYIARMKNIALGKVIVPLVTVILLSGGLSYYLVPAVHNRINNLQEEAGSVHGRTIAWNAALSAIRERPLTGWGFGKQIFHMDEPFFNTPSGKRPMYHENEPFDDPHNTFLSLLFHQGLAGFVPYCAMLFISISFFCRKAFPYSGIRSYILIACISVLAGNYIMHAMFTLFRAKHLAFILGAGIAAAGTDEDN